MKLSSKEIIDLLHLEPHPTCGLVKQTYLSKTILPKSALPDQFGSDRPAGSILYFMVTQETQIKLHKIRSDQMYHFYFGTPLEVLLLYPDGNAEIKVAGDDIKAGMAPQLFIPGNTYHVSRLHEEGSYSLLGTSEWIGVEPEDVELGNPEELCDRYPRFKKEIQDFTKK